MQAEDTKQLQYNETKGNFARKFVLSPLHFQAMPPFLVSTVCKNMSFLKNRILHVTNAQNKNGRHHKEYRESFDSRITVTSERIFGQSHSWNTLETPSFECNSLSGNVLLLLLLTHWNSLNHEVMRADKN